MEFLYPLGVILRSFNINIGKTVPKGYSLDEVIMDCNKCKYLSCTEIEQKHFKRVFNEEIPHICIKYNKQVFHMAGATRSLSHSAVLHPCDQCIEKPEYVEVNT